MAQRKNQPPRKAKKIKEVRFFLKERRDDGGNHAHNGCVHLGGTCGWIGDDAVACCLTRCQICCFSFRLSNRTIGFANNGVDLTFLEAASVGQACVAKQHSECGEEKMRDAWGCEDMESRGEGYCKFDGLATRKTRVYNHSDVLCD